MVLANVVKHASEAAAENDVSRPNSAESLMDRRQRIKSGTRSHLRGTAASMKYEQQRRLCTTFDQQQSALSTLGEDSGDPAVPLSWTAGGTHNLGREPRTRTQPGWATNFKESTPARHVITETAIDT